MPPPNQPAAADDLDLSAGIVRPPPAQGGDGLDLSAGIVHPTAPITIADKIYSLMSADPNVGMGIGAVKGAMNTAAGIGELINKYAVAPLAAGTPGTAQRVSDVLKEGTDWLREHGQPHGISEHIGDYGEGAAELLLPETWAGKAAEAGEALSAGDRLIQAGKNMKILDANQGLQQLAKVGLATLKSAATGATLAGGQTFVKTGGDVERATSAAALGGLAGGAIGAGGGAVEALANKVAATKAAIEPDVVNILGEDIPRFAAQRTPGTPEARVITSTSAPEIQAAQQAGAQTAYGNLSTRVAQRALDAYGITAKPAANLGDAADQIKRAATHDYEELDTRTGGRFDAFRQAITDATTPPERETAQQNLNNFFDEIDDPRYPDQLRDLAIRARNATRKQSVAEDIHDLLDRTFNYPSAESAAEQGQPYMMNVRGERDVNMRPQVDAIERKYGRPELQELLGSDGLKNLRDMADVTDNPAQSANRDNIVNELYTQANEGMGSGGWKGGILGKMLGLGWGKGQIIGAAIGGAKAIARPALYQMALNPRIGSMLTYAARRGISPRYAAALIGTAMSLDQQQRQTAPNQQPGGMPP